MTDALEYTVKLVDQITAPAKAASGAVTQATKSLVTFDQVVAEAAKRQQELATDLGKQTDMYLRNVQAQKSAIKSQQDAAKAQKDADYAKKLDVIKDRQDAAAKSSGELTATMGKAALGFAATAAAAAAYAVVAGAAFALEASQAKQQMISLFDSLGQGKVRGAELDDMLTGLRTSLGQTKDSMKGYVSAALTMGVTDKATIANLTTAAVSAKALTGGNEAAADSFLKLQEKLNAFSQAGQPAKIAVKGLGTQLAGMGLSLDDVSTAMGMTTKQLGAGLKAGTVNALKLSDALSTALKTKGAGAVQAASLTWQNQIALLKDSIGDLFEDVDAKPFLSAFRDVLSIFDQSTESGKAMKFVVTSFFNGVFQVAGKVMPYVKHLLLDMVIAALKIYIAAKPLVAELKKVFGSADGETVTKALHFVVEFMMNGIIFTIRFYLAMLKLWEAIFAGAKAVKDFVAGAGQAASDFVTGFVNGIVSGGTAVVNAVKNLGTQALNTLKSTLKISSPSKVMLEMGGHTAEGFAQGIEARAPRAAGASKALAGAAASGAGAASTRAASSISPSVTVNIYGVQGADELRDEFPSLLALAFERMALQGGGA